MYVKLFYNRIAFHGVTGIELFDNMAVLGTADTTLRRAMCDGEAA
jgi:hypothetical protein